MSEIFGATHAEETTAKTVQIIDEPAETVNAPSPLALLAEEGKKDIDRKVIYDVTERPGWSAEFSTSISTTDYDRYTRSARGKKKRPEDADIAIFTGMALAERNTGILYQGKRVQDEKGQDVVIASEEFLTMFGAFTAVEAVIKFFGDGHTVTVANALYVEAGYGDEAARVDPTDA